MPSISIPDLSDDTYKKLCHLKIDLNCANWSELMTKLVETVGNNKPLTPDQDQSAKSQT